MDSIWVFYSASEIDMDSYWVWRCGRTQFGQDDISFSNSENNDLFIKFMHC
jgi:hypothetical protein